MSLPLETFALAARIVAAAYVIFGLTVAGLLLQEGLIICSALLIPAMLAGSFVGNRLHTVISATSVVRAVYSVLILTGVSVLVRGSA